MENKITVKTFEVEPDSGLRAVEVGETTTERAHARSGTAYFANEAAKARAATSARAQGAGPRLGRLWPSQARGW